MSVYPENAQHPCTPIRSAQKDEKFGYVGGGTHNYCAYCTGDTQKIKVFMQTVSELKEEMKVDG